MAPDLSSLFARQVNRKGSRQRLVSDGGLILVLLVAGLLVASPRIANAHAAFVSSQPEPGQQLGSTPGVVVLQFTEPLNERLSRAAVIDPTGRRFEATASGPQRIEIPLRSSAPGVYDVEWTTVSTVDGHALHGTFQFGVGVSPGGGSEQSTSFAPRRSDLVIAVARAVEYAALFIAVGMLLLGRLARREPALSWLRTPLRVPLAVSFVTGIVVVVGEAIAAAPSPSWGAILNYLTTGSPGIARVARVSFEGLALVASFFARRMVAPLIVAAFAALAAAGHAAAVRPLLWGAAVDTVHLIAAGLWAGAIMAMVVVRPPGGWRGPEARSLLDRFSPVAVMAFLVTVGAGILRGAQELGEFGDLFTSSYGQVLSVKVLLVLAMVPLSLRAWRRLAASPRLEAAMAVFVVAAAALLAAYPLPPARVDEADAAPQKAASVSALPREGDITIGGSAGEVLVGLTLRPGRPGTNQVLVYLLPLQGEEAAAGVPACIVIDGQSLAMQECGPTCRRLELELHGRERLDVRVGGPKGGTAAFQLPDLPAEGADRLLEHMQLRMHQLRTYRVREVLRPATPPLVARYAFQAPNRMRMELSNGFERVVIGKVSYSRERPGAAWRKEPAARIEVPSFIWDFGRAFVAPTLLGESKIEGVPTRVASFFGGPRGTPIWFRLWIDSDRLVRRAEMRAQGHFMDHRYHAFNSGFLITPPIEVPE